MSFRSVFAEFGQRLADGVFLITQSLPFDATADRIVGRLRSCGAVSPERARSFHPRTGHEERVFLHLVQLGIIRESTPGRYYLVRDNSQGIERLWRRS